MSIKVLVADDHEVVRHGLACLFKNTDIEIVGQACDGNEAVKNAKMLRPDVVLMDLKMPHCDGLKALKRIQDELPGVRVVMLSTYDNPTYVARSAVLGASDYVLKGTPRKQLLAAIRHAARGESPSSDSIMMRIKETLNKRGDAYKIDSRLTNRELQVLRHVALGLSNFEIGRSLGISVETVKEHVQNLLRKIDATDRTQAAVWAVREGIV